MPEKMKKGTDVMVVTAKGTHVPADVIQDNEDGTVDLKFTYEGQPVTITRSPRDDSGKRHDSWHLPAPKVAVAPAAAE